jgi:hypothetical protein
MAVRYCCVVYDAQGPYSSGTWCCVSIILVHVVTVEYWSVVQHFTAMVSGVLSSAILW